MSLFHDVDHAFAALERDLRSEEGPRISTMRNYRFAILAYEPGSEARVRRLTASLLQRLQEDSGWHVCLISLHALLLRRLRGLGPEQLAAFIDMERRVTTGAQGTSDWTRGVDFLTEQIGRLIEGPDGLAADVVAELEAHRARHPDEADRTVAFIARAGALYPFFRSSALLKHLDGRTGGIPVVLFYPGTRDGDAGLSFMGQVAADRDYRPRIYGQETA